MLRFNIALLPEDSQLSQSLSAYAQSNFADADGYLLGPDTLPHVTLCQFRAANEDTARNIFRAWQTPRSMPVHLAHFYLAPGSVEHEGKIWAGFSIQTAAELLNLQQTCRTHIEAHGCTPLMGKPYWPHFTLARLSKWPVAPISFPKDIPFMQPIACQPALGLSSEEGVFLRHL